MSGSVLSFFNITRFGSKIFNSFDPISESKSKFLPVYTSGITSTGERWLFFFELKMVESRTVLIDRGSGLTCSLITTWLPLNSTYFNAVNDYCDNFSSVNEAAKLGLLLFDRLVSPELIDNLLPCFLFLFLILDRASFWIPGEFALASLGVLRGVIISFGKSN